MYRISWKIFSCKTWSVIVWISYVLLFLNIILAKQGTRVVVPYRDEDTKRHLRPMGDLGQIIPLELDIRNPEQIAECVRHSDIVYNLIGRDYETK